MTSSLVGSEMCIRDSQTTTKKRYPKITIARIIYHTWMWNYQGNFRKSVSYTHLTLPTICSV
eukprot:1419798-Prorocentrum_lima.AAC.1